jgi:hypothetical protein
VPGEPLLEAVDDPESADPDDFDEVEESGESDGFEDSDESPEEELLRLSLR